MLQFPDFEEKQILFIESYDFKEISFENHNLVVYQKGTSRTKISLYKIFALFIIGEITLTSVLIRKLLEYGVTVVLLKKNFLAYHIIGNETQGNFVLRKFQYETSPEHMLHIAKQIVISKTKNQLSLLQELRNKSPELKGDIQKAKNIIHKLPSVDNYESLLGYEGNVAKLFFSNYYEDLFWVRRSPRTKIDIPNLLLDIGYTYLFHFIEALLRLYGFDTFYGVYHKGWYQRKSLALDLMEPFRPIIDKALRKAYNLGQINKKDFSFKNGQYHLDWKKSQKYSKIFLQAILTYKKDMFYFIKSYYKFSIKGVYDCPSFYISDPI